MARGGSEYAELHLNSAYSLLDGAALPETYVERARDIGLRALALTDHDDMGGVVRFAEKARELDDFPAIIGVELTVGDEADPTGGDMHPLTLLARDGAGYANLGRLVTRSRGLEPRGRPRVSLDALAAHTDGLYCLSGGPRGLVPRALAAGDALGARRAAGHLRDMFGAHFAVEVMDHGLPEEARLAGGLIHLAREMDVPWVVTNNVHYATPGDRILHDVLTCLRHHTTLDEAGRRLKPNAEWHLKAPHVMAERWRHAPEGLRASVEIAEQCTFRFAQLEPALPSVPLPDGFEDADAFLSHLTWEGARARWGRGITEWHRKQLDKELDLIRRKGLSGYFLIMWEIVQYAREVEILVQGRGSAANSAVCYCLGITAVDPIRFDLLFERFLSDARDGYPDIDLDIEHSRREEIIQFVYRRYGRTHAAMVCAHNCFRGKSAVRDTARVLGFGFDEGGRLAEQARRDTGFDADSVRRAGFDPDRPRMKALLKVVRGLWGLPRHRSIHVGGFVLSTTPIAEICPVEPAAMAGRTVIQWDKDDLDGAGLPKFDLLGLGILSVLAEGLGLVRERHGVPATLYSLPDRQEVYDMIARADTVGTFQIESRAQMNTLPRTRPRTLYELAIQVALIRPGPLQGDMVHPYIRRKRGEEPIDLIHPSLTNILRRTLGVPLFQEQGMRLAVVAGGFSLDEAERLRKAVGSERHRHKLAPLMDKLRAGMADKGIDPEAGERIIKQIEAFSTYGFPESHSTSFALLVYASCWLKCFYPAEFLVAMLNAQPMGFYAPATLIKDAQRHGVGVRPPCLAHSAWDARMDGHCVRLGLRSIVGLGPRTRDRVEAARADGPFRSAEDVVHRVELSDGALRILAEAGAFDAFVPGGRRDAVWKALHLARSVVGPLPLRAPPDPPVRFVSLTPREETIADLRTMALTTGPHLVAHVRDALDARGVITAEGLRQARHHQWVKVAGIVNTRQRPPTAKGFFFLTLEDETGFVNVIVPPKVFERSRPTLTRAPFIEVEGPVSCEQGVFNVKGRRFTALDVKGAKLAVRAQRWAGATGYGHAGRG